jgi:ubiquinone/menaquinone biosynthesis C-methylase UbiE
MTERRFKKFVNSFDPDPGQRLLGLGCTDGTLTRRVADRIGTRRIFGIELDRLVLSKAKKKLGVVASDLNVQFPLKDACIDVVSADQVIEHLVGVDSFVREIYRVLTKGGYAVICTENLSAWHNLLALSFGFQAFCQTVSTQYYVGNPLSPHYGKCREKSRSRLWSHVQIFTLKGLKDLFSINGFEVLDCWGSGYFPLSRKIGSIFERIDPVHSYHIALKVRKPI